jgi:uncharacterized protein
MRLGLMMSVLALLVGAVGVARAQPAADPDTLAQAKALMDKTGSGALSQQIFSAILQRQKAMLESANPGKSAAIGEIIGLLEGEYAKQLPKLVDAFAKIYTTHFSAEELRGLNAFYDSPLGRKLLKELAVLIQEGMAVGQAFGRNIATEVINKLRPEFEKRNLKLESNKT